MSQNHRRSMPELFTTAEIGIITDDLRVFLGTTKASIDKLDYFTSQAKNLQQNGFLELAYSYEQVNIIPEVETAVIQQLEIAEQKQLSVQLHLSPASIIVTIDRLFFQQVFFRLLDTLLNEAEKGSVVSVYVTGNDGKCTIELINRLTHAIDPDDYFRKYRITNVLPIPENDQLFVLYARLIGDMGGELVYDFEKEKYFRVRFEVL